MMAKKLYNGWKHKPERCCLYCGRPYAERHEVFPGSNRQISIRENFQIDLCPEHHREIQANCTEWAQRENVRWKQHFEREYIREQMKGGASKQQAVRAWMELIGRNYCDEIIPE